MEDYSSNEKAKPEKQRRNVMYMLFGQYVYMCNVCIVLLFLYSFIKICYFSHLALNLFLEMPI